MEAQLKPLQEIFQTDESQLKEIYDEIDLREQEEKRELKELRGMFSDIKTILDKNRIPGSDLKERVRLACLLIS